ncbi:MAG: hypothetical protein RIC16_05705 [Rhodospirillales bacterium]
MDLARIAATAVLIGVLSGPALSQEMTPVVVPAPGEAGITLYQNGIGVIDETRNASIGAAGPTRLTLTGVAPATVDGSAVIAVDGLDIRRLVYRLRPLSRQLILEGSVGGTVDLVRTHPETGAETVETAEVLGLDGGRAILRIGDRVETDAPGRIAFAPLDAALVDRPAIDAAGHALAPGGRDLGLRYLAGGLGWHTEYVIEAKGSEASPSLDVTGWASVRNDSGRAFRARPLNLVAGDVNRTSPTPQLGAMPVIEGARMMTMAAADAGAMPERTAAGDVHVYALGGPVDLAAGETTQVRLLHQEGVTSQRRYVLEGGGHWFRGHYPGAQPFENPAVEIRFTNEGTEPLPAGNARVFDGSRLLGEAPVPSTPAGEEVTLDVGRSFDIIVRRIQTAYRKLGPPDNDIESAHVVRLRNAKPEDVTVEVRQHIGGDWEIIETSLPLERDGLAAVWRVPVPAAGGTELSYVVRVRR